MHCYFLSSDSFDLNDLKGIDSFIDQYPDFQTVHLLNEEELKILFELINIPFFPGQDLPYKDFSSYWDLSNYKFPEMNEKDFDLFYENWIERTKRENTMDEYGSLIFLQGLGSTWNKRKFRVIVKDRN